MRARLTKQLSEIRSESIDEIINYVLTGVGDPGVLVVNVATEGELVTVDLTRRDD